ncbi:MAG TPA: DUF1801 domain-containing protein [Allosphingosinicella sp.]|nr:DUF1801 domain-containing protein [Allosphingosinicella sp.]
MAENKTKPTGDDVSAFLAAIPDPTQRADAQLLAAMMARVTGEAPRVWDNKMIGFGTYSYKTGAGHKGQWIRTGFAVRKGTLTIHLMDGVKTHEAALARLGPYRNGVSCLYIKRLADVDEAVLEGVVAASHAAMNLAFPDA